MKAAHFLIEIPKGGLIKWGSDGQIDYFSPVPSPFNYGSIPATKGEDGDPLDVIVLGARLPRGTTGILPVQGCVRFVDCGQRDDKWVCAPHPLRRRDRLLLQMFFTVYALPKSVKGCLMLRGRSRLLGIDVYSEGSG